MIDLDIAEYNLKILYALEKKTTLLHMIYNITIIENIIYIKQINKCDFFYTILFSFFVNSGIFELYSRYNNI